MSEENPCVWCAGEKPNKTAALPLRLRVAQALGEISNLHAAPGGNAAHYEGGGSRIPDYDTDWSATGPLIERFEIHLQPERGRGWGAFWSRGGDDYVGDEGGDTPLIAVCNLILALKEAGKL